MIVDRRGVATKLLASFMVLLLFSSDRNLLITHYILGKQNISWMTIVFILIAASFALVLSLEQGRFLVRKEQKKLILVSSLLASYFLVHEMFFGDSLVSAKYAVFLAILIFALLVRYRVYYVFKILGYFGGLICFCVVLQQILLFLIVQGDLSEFQVAIRGEDWSRWQGCDFVLPYGLGLIERCYTGYDVLFSGVQIHRSIFFTTEPKYLSSILLVTLSFTLISNPAAAIRKALIWLHVVALGFVFSASAILILIGSTILVLARGIGPFVYTTIVFLFPIFVFPLLFLILSLVAGIEGFLLNRIVSASHSAGLGELTNLSLFGEAFSVCEDRKCRESEGLVSNLLVNYGMMGFSLFWAFLYLAIKPVFKAFKDKQIKASKYFGLVILLNSYVVFNIYFFGDLFNMYGLLIMLSVILLPEYLARRNKIPSYHPDLSS